ncbi:HAD hydrolase-like protein [Sphingobacterium sp. lm-10]|uniref:HAD hydrolase-like protein n=1 Tax=Sphingobacterium sp. lm-10 TaxID=2944904 RepID=UPI0020210665|nr:HAD hydrolase-like protein [Sphingobacterium sp. lm-10]MCL7988137.1 HAD hydrolase-like protein [Sphingobacterium sp. lm-10]
MKRITPATDKHLYLFEVDDVLYAKRDFILQIYYLFGQFVEFTESKPVAAAITQFMKAQFEANKTDGLLQAIQKEFGLNEDYTENFERLQANAHLPLKLLLLDEIKENFQTLISAGKQLAILTEGNPILQLNKLKHVDWDGWDRQIKIYFTDELVFRNLDPFAYIADEFGVDTAEIEYIR